MARIIFCPGWVTSKTDGQRHYISAAKLAELYGVPFGVGQVFPCGPGFKQCPGDVFLEPRYDGKYFHLKWEEVLRR